MSSLGFNLLPPPRYPIMDGAEGEAFAEMQATLVAGTTQQLRELARMRAVGMRMVRQIDRDLRGKSSEAETARFARGSKGLCWDFIGVARAVRQIIVLEHELAGLRPAERISPEPVWKPEPEARRPSDLPYPYRERDDVPDYYDSQPLGTAVDWIRDTLDIEPPDADPFEAAGRRRRSASSAPPEAPVVDDVPVKPADLVSRHRDPVADRKEMKIARERVIDGDDDPWEPAWRPPTRGPPDG